MLALVQRTGREFGISVLVCSHLLGELERICDGVVLVEQGRLVRAERLNTLMGETGTLIVEVDGDATAFTTTLTGAGIVAQQERQRVLVNVPDGDDALRVVCDSVRDAAALHGVGLLRIERRRGHLEDLFAVSTGASS
jgi:ABC-2 type transport system ATP-binding protein